MAKMHQLLAAETAVASALSRDFQETLKVLGRPDLFRRVVKTKTHFADDDKHLDASETKEITTRVRERLEWSKNAFADFFDIQFQKDRTNQTAKADIEVDGKVLAKDVPTTTLLMLENKLQDVRKMIEDAPTLAVGVRWVYDENERLFVTAEPVEAFSTRKVVEPVVLYHATKEHPAQVEKVSKDVPVAKITQTEYSGMLTSAEKADMLSRLDKLLIAVKSARQKANDAEVVSVKMGNDIMNYVLSGT